MKLRELENVISDDASVSLDVLGSNSLPNFYTWKELKKIIKSEGWDATIHKITSYAGIYIVLEAAKGRENNE